MPSKDLTRFSLEELERQIKNDEFLMDFLSNCKESAIPVEQQQALFARYLICCRLKELREKGEAHGSHE